MEFEFGAINRSRQELSVTVEGVAAGSLRLGAADADDSDDPKVHLDYVQVHEPFRGSEVSIALIRQVRARWPAARIVGGPPSDDDPPGPRFRLRCWDWDLGVEIHEPNCRLGSCECRAAIVERSRSATESGSRRAD